MQKENLREKKKPVNTVHKKLMITVLIVIMSLFVMGCVWKAVRKTGSIPCGLAGGKLENRTQRKSSAGHVPYGGFTVL